MSIVETEQKPLALNEQLKNRESHFRAALPAHIPVERFMRVVMTAMQNNPALIAADRQSLWNASMRAAQDGLLPDGREGALVIFRTKVKDEGWIDKVQWLPMVAGLRKKVRNSGEIATWDAQVVHAKDQFEVALGDDPFIKHRPYLPPMIEIQEGESEDEFAERFAAHSRPGPVIAAYSVAVLKGGEKSREVMTRAQLDKVRAASKTPDKGPWVDWFEEMCRKTVARRHSKVLPMSTDLDDLIRRDDELYDLKNAAAEARELAGDRPRSLAAKLDALAAPLNAMPKHDPETGEIAVPEREEPSSPATPLPAEATTANEPSNGAEPESGSFGSAPADQQQQQQLDPIMVARQRGALDRKNGMQRRALPPEYRSEARAAEANAWRHGHDNPDDVLEEKET